MLTRLKVSGFKNLVDVDVHFGPFTCIAGANGIGKSNLFDAIQFLSALSHRSLVEAALSVRDEGGRSADVKSLFHRVGDDFASEMSFEAEMIVPSVGVDDLGQEAKAKITLLRYGLTLAYRPDDTTRRLPGSLEVIKEELIHINLGDATKHLNFPHEPSWRKSVVQGRRTSPFISTEGTGENRVIKLHQDGSSGRPLPRAASTLPRTVLSVVNAAESPTALIARREMQSWRLLQLEPSSLRKPDEFNAPIKLGTDGSHLSATLYHLAHTNKGETLDGLDDNESVTQIYGEVANRLSQLIDDVRRVWVDRDDRRETLTLNVHGNDGTSHPARALSDGTLRFLALAVLALDPNAQGLLCLEEPENGIHPERIPAMLALLQDIVTDVEFPVSPDNPLRQVIINTHSPSVVLQVPDDSLLVAESRSMVRNGKEFKRVCFSGLSDTWRQKAVPNSRSVSKGVLLGYLNPVIIDDPENSANSLGDKPSPKRRSRKEKSQRVVDRDDMKQLLLPYTLEGLQK